MPTWIGLLRGINVGGKTILPMARLVEHMQAAGCTNVRTYIQSGNTVFDHRGTDPVKIGAAITAAIAAASGFAPKTLVLSAADLVAAADASPYPRDAGKAVHVFFLADAPTQEAIDSLAPLRTGSEQYAVIGRAMYFYAPDGFSSAKIAVVGEKKLGVAATARNWNTVQKLLAMVAESAPVATPKRAAPTKATQKKATPKKIASRRT